VANYNIDFLVSIKNTNKLAAFNKQLDATGKKVRETVQGLSEIGQISKTNIANIGGFSNALRQAQQQFNQTVRGAKEFNLAARQLIQAERQYNKELEKRQTILNNLRQGSSFTQFSRRASQIQSPTTFNTAEQKAIDRNQRKLDRRAGIRPLEFGAQPMVNQPFAAINLSGVTARRARTANNILSLRQERFGNVNPGQLAPDGVFGVPGGRIGAPQMRVVNRKGGFLEFNKIAKKIQADTKKMASVITSQGTVAGAPVDTTAFSSPISPRRANIFNTMGFGRGANPKGVFANSKGAAGRISSAASSGLIGGGFPLLFGQGGLAAGLGGIGGLAGGALGGGFGFGLSIAGTAIASRIQETIDFRKAVDKLNVSIKATGGTSTFTAKQVAEFAKSLGMTKDEALEALKAFKQFEASARITLLKTFGSEGTFDIFAGLKDNASIISALPGLSKELGINQAISALETLKSKDATATQDQLLGNIISKNKEIIKQESKKVGFFEKLNPFRGKFKLNDPSKGILGGGGFMTVEELEEFKAKNAGAEFDSLIVQAKERLRLQRQFNEELERQAIIKAPVDELNRLLDPLTQIDQLGKSIGNSFSESFKGIVKGSMTAQEALRNLFMRTADHFLDMAAQMLAAQIRSGIFGLFSSFLNPTFGTGMGSNPAGMRQQGVGVSANRLNRHVVGHSSIQPKANGGLVNAGKSYMVGERGAEMFVPNAGGRIVPNSDLGGSTNIVVNVDASGSSVEGDEEEGRELGRLISVAIQSELIKQKRPGGMLA